MGLALRAAGRSDWTTWSLGTLSANEVIMAGIQLREAVALFPQGSPCLRFGLWEIHGTKEPRYPGLEGIFLCGRRFTRNLGHGGVSGYAPPHSYCRCRDMFILHGGPRRIELADPV